MAGQKDIHNTMFQATLAAQEVINSDTVTLSAIIDTVKFSGHEFLVIGSSINDGEYVISIQEGDEVDDEANPTSIDDGATAASEDILATLANLTLTVAETGLTTRLGYIGTKRWLRVEITSTNTSAGAVLNILSVQENAKRAATEDSVN